MLDSQIVTETPSDERAIQRLRDCPNGGYLLHEFEILYRQGSAGGCKAIRSHRKRVRGTLPAVIDSNPEVIERAQENIASSGALRAEVAARNQEPR